MNNQDVIVKVWMSDYSRKCDLRPVLERRINFEALSASAYIISVLQILFGKQCCIVFEHVGYEKDSIQK